MGTEAEAEEGEGEAAGEGGKEAAGEAEAVAGTAQGGNPIVDEPEQPAEAAAVSGAAGKPALNSAMTSAAQSVGGAVKPAVNGAPQAAAYAVEWVPVVCPPPLAWWESLLGLWNPLPILDNPEGLQMHCFGP
jgi:hypothetical protein